MSSGELSIVESPYSAGTLLAGRYRVEKYLGSGGMGWVLQAKDEALGDETLALKVLYPHLVEEARSFERFRSEILITRRLLHPNIVRTYSFVSLDVKSHLITMECVKGNVLSDIVAAGAMPIKSCIEILFQIAHGLTYAHSLGVIHRDLKPDNILIDDSGDSKIVDFGISQIHSKQADQKQDLNPIGTPHYMSPEQFRGEVLDSASDVYSFGILAYEIACGQRPFDGRSLFALAEAHCHSPLPSVRFKRTEIPQWYEELIYACTEKSREKRTSSFDEICALLAPHLDLPPEGLKQVNTGPVEIPDKTRPAVETSSRHLPEEQRMINKILLKTTIFAMLADLFVYIVASDQGVREAALVIFLFLSLLLVSLKVRFKYRLFTMLGSIPLLLIVIVKTNPATWKRTAALVIDTEISTGLDLSLLRSFLNVKIDPRDPQVAFSVVKPNSMKPRGDSREFDKYGLWIILNSFIPIDIVNKEGQHLLHYAAEIGQSDHVLKLIEKGIDPNVRDSQQRTPIHYAVEKNGNPRTALALLEIGVDFLAIDDAGRSPLWLALKRGTGSVMEILLAKKGAIDQELIVEGRKVTPFHLLVRRYTLYYVIRGCAHLNNPNVIDYRGRTALHEIVLTDFQHPERLEIAKLLLEKGVSPDIADKNGLSPMDYAAKREDVQMQALLRQYSARVANPRKS